MLAHNALEFYSSGEQVASRAQDAFDLIGRQPHLRVRRGLRCLEARSNGRQIAEAESDPPLSRPVRFHQDDDDQSALLDADLLRLNFGNNMAFGEEKDGTLQGGAETVCRRTCVHGFPRERSIIWPRSSMAKATWSRRDKIASEGLNRFPDSVGGRRCYNLIQQIEARSSRVTTERVWNDPRPTIDVHYRNVTQDLFSLGSV